MKCSASFLLFSFGLFRTRQRIHQMNQKLHQSDHIPAVHFAVSIAVCQRNILTLGAGRYNFRHQHGIRHVNHDVPVHVSRMVDSRVYTVAEVCKLQIYINIRIQYQKGCDDIGDLAFFLPQSDRRQFILKCRIDIKGTIKCG